ncbi:MAG: lactonase family protein [Verrucomicrobiota bacterium]
MRHPFEKAPFCLAAVLSLSAARAATASDMFVYFGTHRSGANAGFSLAHFDTDTGALTKPEFLLESPAPAYFVLHPDGRHLYACNSGDAATVSAYEIEPHTGHLTFLNRAATGGGDTSYISLDQTGRYALAANYDGGSIAVFALKPDGGFGERTAFVQHTGSGVNPQRQSHPFAHSIITDPDNKFALVADLGLDKILVYRFDALITEMGSTILAFNWNPTNGALAQFQSVSTLPEGFQGASTCAEMLVHPNGKFLYGSNRGDDSLVVFAIDPTSGRLALVQRAPSGGRTPRNFAFDPTGKWILCTNHGSDNAVVFRVDESTGRLTQTGQPVSVPYPFCERFLPVR